jgi:ABC-type nickel/cobalt efflux system permease component RcnA
MVLGVGITLLYRRLFSQEKHHHHHHYEDKHHAHSHHHDTNMSSSLIALGVAGGLVPCPSALVLLLSSVTLHKIPYGLLLTGSFSLGLALVLVMLGLLTVYAHQWFEGVSFSMSWLKNLSVFSAIFVVLIGLGLTTFAILEMI